MIRSSVQFVKTRLAALRGSRVAPAGRGLTRGVAAGLLAGALSLGIGARAAAQDIGDWPVIKGLSSQVGRNGDPNATGPGQGLLRWFRPQVSTLEGISFDIDNTDVDSQVTASNYFEGLLWNPIPNPLGLTVASPALTGAGSAGYATQWAAPQIAEEAPGAFRVLVDRTANSADPNRNSRQPGYFYTRTTPSAVGPDPTLAANPGDRRFFEFRVGPATAQPVNYALYTHLPVGATIIPGLDRAGRRFQQRYVVVEVLFGTAGQQRYIDVIDTYLAGTNYVRIGNGGRPTNVVFPYSGDVNERIRVRIYNTIPRTPTGELSTPSPFDTVANTQATLVYADAVKAVPQHGSIVSTATVGTLGTGVRRVVTAVNEQTVSFRNGAPQFETSAVVRSYNNDTDGTPVWSFRPSSVGTTQFQEYDDASAAVTYQASPAWTATVDPQALNGSYHGTPAISSAQPTDPPPARTTWATLTPSGLPAGDYRIEMYAPGGPTFARRVRVSVFEGTDESVFEVDLSSQRGYVRVGDQRFTHNPLSAPLRVEVSNVSQGDAGLTVAVDGFRFSGIQTAVTSTPIQGQVLITPQGGGTPVETPVVIVPDESGRIHCLDARGNPDGTTTQYWVYPSRRAPGFLDPNLTEGIDGPSTNVTDASVPTAEMPTGFDLSSGVIARINGKDYFYIASRNGRVYCIDMAGRGDYDPATRVPGSARRMWTWPNDYPNPAQDPGTLSFQGSLVYRPAISDAEGTILVPARNGRLYALRALPGSATVNRTTQTRWIFPPLNTPAAGPFLGTPAVEFGRVYIGSSVVDDFPGRLYALNENTGAVDWLFPTDAAIASGAVERTGSFVSGPASVPGTVLGGGMPDTVYALNDNGNLYALDAATGAFASDGTTTFQPTKELGVNAIGNLSYTTMTVYDAAGALVPDTPVIVVPAQDGRYTAMFARASTLNRFDGRRAWEYRTTGEEVIATPTISGGTMFGADTAGYLYAWSNVAGPGGGGFVPGQPGIVENDPSGNEYRNAKIRLLTKAAYDALRRPNPSNLSRAEALDPSNSFTRNPLAFEWGETAYILVYDFPYDDRNTSNNPVAPPVVNVSFSVGGRSVRQIPVEARLFRGATVNTPDSGYAVLAFTFQGSGASALPPGDAQISVSISTAALNGNGVIQNIALNPALTRVPFQLSNPLGVAVRFDAAGQALNNYQIGASSFPSHPANLVNGSPRVLGTPPTGDPVGLPPDSSRLQTSFGLVDHGRTAQADFVVYDRSMMGLIRPDGKGLDNVRVWRREMQWQGLTSTVYKALNATRYPGFEELPANIQPNTSLDYPDIGRDNLRFIKDPNGNAENPVNFSVSLKAPRVSNGVGGFRDLQEGDTPESRVLTPTRFRAQVTVPRYQPPNNAFVGFLGGPITDATLGTPPADPRFRQPDSAGLFELPQGYLSRIAVFVDGNGDGALDFSSQETNRTLNLTTAVAVDERVTTATGSTDPSGAAILNLESLPGGAGYSLDAADPFTPWGSAHFKAMFKPFIVRNEGNVNLLDLRVVKGSRNVLNGTPQGVLPARFNATGNDDTAWLNGLFDLHSDISAPPLFAPNFGGANFVALQKSRPGDSAPNELSPNPIRRENANLGALPGPLLDVNAYPPGAPRIGVSVPLGFPAGQYSQSVYVVENALSNELFDASQTAGVERSETFTNPGFLLNFTVRESRVTGGPSDRRVSPLVDSLFRDAATAAGARYTETYRTPFAYRNRQPAGYRDLSGSMVVAYASDRTTANPTALPTANAADEATRIFVQGLDSSLTFNGNGISQPTPSDSDPLRDLRNWQPNGGRWFGDGVTVPATGVNADTFWTIAGVPLPGLVNGTDTYRHPSFPAKPNVDPYTGATFNGSVAMAFVGEAQRGSGGNRTDVSNVFVAPVSVSGANMTVGTPLMVPGRAGGRLGRPSVLQTSETGIFVMYPRSLGGKTNIEYSEYAGTAFGAPISLDFGAGFDSVSSASFVARPYRGVDTARFNNARTDVVFTGRPRNAAADEVYMGTMGQVVPNDKRVAMPWLDLGETVGERVTGSGSSYRTRGVYWRMDRPIRLQLADGTDILTGSPTRVPDTSLVTYATIFGGRATIDPYAGAVRFSGGAPARSAVISATYTPYFLRLSSSPVAAYNGAQGMWDDRNISEVGYWANAGTGVDRGFGVANDRLVFSAVRGAAGPGTATRPYFGGMRLGVRLPTRADASTSADGTPTRVTVTGATGPWQLDAVSGRVYFNSVDEDRVVTVTYQPVDANGQPVGGTVDVTAPVRLLLETAERPVPIEGAAAETGAYVFLDPFGLAGVREARPGLFWSLWTSGRGNGSEIFFQSFAPQLGPVPINR